MKNKKIQAIIIASAITVNLLMPATSAFANDRSNSELGTSSTKLVDKVENQSDTNKVSSSSSTETNNNAKDSSNTVTTENEVDNKSNLSSQDKNSDTNIEKENESNSTENTYKPGWNQIDSYTYYINNEGNKSIGWQTINGAKFYFGEDGKLRTGWQNIGDGRYYFWEANQKAKSSSTPIGAMATDSYIQIDGQNYSFNSNGKLNIEDEVKIPDINLKHELNKRLGESDLDAPITKEQLSNLEGNLDLYYKNINNIEGLQYCTGVTHIDLNGDNIEDLSPLKSLTNLKWLNIANNSKLNDLSYLKGLTSLTWLDFDNTNVKDLTPINGLTNLNYLSFNNAKVSDLSPIKELTNIKSLMADSNNIKDISVLQNLNITTLKLANQNITLPEVKASNENISMKNEVVGVSNDIAKMNISNISGNGKYDEKTNSISWQVSSESANESYSFSQKLEQGTFSGKVYVTLKVDGEKKLNESINEIVDKTDINNVNNLLDNKELSKNLYAKEIISRLGEMNFIEFKNKDKEHNDFINWLLSDDEAMEYYLTGGLPSKSPQGDMRAYLYENDTKVDPAKELSALEVWSKIWNSDKDSSQGIDLKIAVATALEFASPVNTWLTGEQIDALSRYNIFKEAYENNELFPCFKDLSIKNLRNVVNAKITDSDILWLRQYIKDLNEGMEDAKFKWQHEHVNNPNVLSQDRIANMCSTIQYTTTNPYGKSVFGSEFYGDNPTIEKVVEYGGVCGAASKFGTLSCQVFGVPAYPVGQPGHCAFLHLTSNGWQLGYDIFGFKGSNGYYTTIPYMLLNEVLNSPENINTYSNSEELRMLAENTNSKEKSQKILDEAIEVEPLNYVAWEDKLNNMLEDSNTTLEQYKDVNSQIINDFAQYPQVMENLLVKIRSKVTTNRQDVQSYVNEYKGALESVKDDREKPYATKLLSDMIQKGLYLATFSFDGENAGKLVGIKANIDEYSLDGGKTYKLVTEDSQKLTNEELKSITPQDGILVRVKGTDNPNLITIKKGQNVNISNNDDENLIFGLDKTMEFSTDEGVTWTKYDGNNLLDLTKDLTLLIRKAATGDTTSGDYTKVVFTSNEAPKGLIFHKDMKVSAYSSEENNTDQAVDKAIDGNRNTFWHTNWDGSDKSPYITLELNNEYNISKLTYMPRQSGNYNGNILEYNIYTSLDGQNFTKVASGSWQSNREVKTATFNETKAKYVKLEVVKGVGGYASGADVSLYAN